MKILLLIALIIPLKSFAEILEVHSVVPNKSAPGKWIVKLIDGRVGFMDQEQNSDVDPGSLPHSVIDAQLSEESVLSGIRIIGKINEAHESKLEKSKQLSVYYPTVYSSYSYATDVLTGMRRQWLKTSQCYDRSHVWTYEEAFHGGYLQKVFLFFSDTYISRYSYKWWFHTAPYALVSMNGQTVERIMDAAFSPYPLQFKLWTDLFMKNKVDCTPIQKYSDYSTHPGEDDCYFMKTSIFYWQPQDLEALEKSGVEKTKFSEWEVKHAYEKAFGIL